MTDSLDLRAETLRLARVLGVEPMELDFLQGAKVADLRKLRIAVMDHMLERNREQFERTVALADRIPVALAAKLAQHSLGPVLGARAAALLSPSKTAELARRLPARFLAEVAIHVDLRKVGPMINGISSRTLRAAGAELRAREEWTVLGAVVAHLEPRVLSQVLGDFDGEALLRAGFMVEERQSLGRVVAILPDHRLDEMIAAADEHGLWDEALALAQHVDEEQANRLLAALERFSGESEPPGSVSSLAS